MTDRDWESVAKRLGISPDAGWPDVIHTLLDRIEAAPAPATTPKRRSSKATQGSSES